MTYRHFKHEGWLYALAFLFAIALRFIQLGAMPLTDAEAAPALQALQIAQGFKPALDPHPFYILFTSVLFFIYGGGTNFLARFIPALLGSLLVFTPLLFPGRIKPRPGLILAFFIALDPGLVSLSRQAASPILAVAFLLFAWGYYTQNKASLAGFFAALALLSGPSIWAGILALAITWAIVQAINSLRSRKSTEGLETIADDPTTTDHPLPALRQAQGNAFDYRTSMISLIATFLIAGTLFFIVPNGLSAALASIPAYIRTWLNDSYVPASRLFFSLLIYQPLVFLLALFAIIRGWRTGSNRIIPLSIWFFVALLLAIFNPSRQMADLVWALIPLLAMAALELTRNVDIYFEERIEVIGVVFLTAFIWTFAWLDFSSLIWLPADSREYIMRFWLLIGSLFLLVMSLLLVAAGWSIRIARIGGILGLALALGVLGLGGALGSAGLRGQAFPELWWPARIPAHADLLEETVSDISEWGLGNDYAAPVMIVGVDSPALEWALREHQVVVVKSLDISSAPYFVITPLQDDPALSSAYRGQDFTWQQTPLWDVAVWQDWIRWIALRDMAQTGETIILWARDDLFLDSNTP
jgi:hypothetical protein